MTWEKGSRGVWRGIVEECEERRGIVEECEERRGEE